MTTAIVKLPTQTETSLAPTEVLPQMSWQDMIAMGDQLVKTGMMPEHVRNGAQAAAIILTGRELGMAPMRALRSLHMVKGKVIESADSQLSRFKACGGHAQFTHLDDARATLVLQHPNGDKHTETFTIEDAKRAGLIRGGDNWSKYPRAMLRSRCITAGLKSLGFEGAVGAYDPDEARAFTVDESEHREDSGPVKTTTRVKYTPDTARKARVEALMTELGITDGRGAYYKEVAGGDYPQSDDETDAAISELEARVAEKKRAAAAAQTDGKDEPGADG